VNSQTFSQANTPLNEGRREYLIRNKSGSDMKNRKAAAVSTIKKYMNLAKVNLLFIFIVTLIKFNTLLDSPRQKQKQQGTSQMLDWSVA
jgi:hypothetical protein